MTAIAAAPVFPQNAVTHTQIVSARKAVLADSARDAGVYDHPVADVSVARARSQTFDFACDIAAEAMWKGYAQVRHSPAHPQVQMVYRDRAHADENLSRARFGYFDRLAGERFGTAVRPHDDGFGLHAISSRLPRDAPSTGSTAWERHSASKTTAL